MKERFLGSSEVPKTMLMNSSREHKPKVPREEQAAQLRMKLQEVGESIQATTASIERLVSKIQEGKKVVEQHGGEKLATLNARLEEETQKEKMGLLVTLEGLKAEKVQLERKLQEL